MPAGAAQVYVLQADAVTFVITGTHAAGGFNLNGDAPAGFGVMVAVKACKVPAEELFVVPLIV